LQERLLGRPEGVPTMMESDPAGIQTVRWAFPPILTAPADARRRLSAQLRAWGIGGSAAEPVLLVADELVANAVEHARTELALEVGFDGTAVVVEVHDESTLPPRLQPHDASAVRGRGLQLVAALAKSWNCVRHTGGKTIRAVVVPALWALTLLASAPARLVVGRRDALPAVASG
jgi:anti-sigma regulatory factor (Ser/Thr protein kinase)